MRMIVNILILISSLLIYAGYGIPGFAYLVGMTVLSYGIGLLIPKWRWSVWVGIGINAAALLLVKLQPVTGFTVLAPLGISYFTLQIITYLAEIYKGKQIPERSLLHYSLFVTYLPHMFLGPIQKYDPSLFLNRRISLDGMANGAARALWGAFKKLIVAARAGVIVNAISADPEQYTGAFALAAMLLYSVQLYCDFSGGMDMVLGISRMLGLHFSENFDAPYLAESMQEFWQRWHITLGTWLRENVYIPLGGNRKGKIRKVMNLVVTFLVSGIWHGVEYLLWGMLNGLFVAVGKKLQTKWKTLNRIGTFLLVTMLWSFFIWPHTATALKMLASLVTTCNYSTFIDQIMTLGLTSGDWIVMGISAVLIWIYDVHAQQLRLRFSCSSAVVKTGIICLLALLVLVFGMYGIGFRAEAFIYSRF